eukprot:GHVS01041449.1.p1 GENE.GHVS01041449.1~~GHVS01041449.1.p1  ORF type:complete len:497 (-),score=66.90 GHVS01041449.1:604-1974(-)
MVHKFEGYGTLSLSAPTVKNSPPHPQVKTQPSDQPDDSLALSTCSHSSSSFPSQFTTLSSSLSFPELSSLASASRRNPSCSQNLSDTASFLSIQSTTFSPSSPYSPTSSCSSPPFWPGSPFSSASSLSSNPNQQPCSSGLNSPPFLHSHSFCMPTSSPSSFSSKDFSLSKPSSPTGAPRHVEPALCRFPRYSHSDFAQTGTLSSTSPRLHSETSPQVCLVPDPYSIQHAAYLHNTSPLSVTFSTNAPQLSPTQEFDRRASRGLLLHPSLQSAYPSPFSATPPNLVCVPAPLPTSLASYSHSLAYLPSTSVFAPFAAQPPYANVLFPSFAQPLIAHSDASVRCSRGKQSCPAKFQSGQKGVSWRTHARSWVATWYDQGKQKHKYFSTEKFGMEGARVQAIAYRKSQERLRAARDLDAVKSGAEPSKSPAPGEQEMPDTQPIKQNVCADDEREDRSPT